MLTAKKKKKILWLTEILEVIETSNIRLVTLWSAENSTGTFLEVQWLRIHLSMQGTWFHPWSGNLDPYMLSGEELMLLNCGVGEDS